MTEQLSKTKTSARRKQAAKWLPWVIGVILLPAWRLAGMGGYEGAAMYAGLFVILFGMTLRTWTTLLLTQVLLLDLAIANHIKLTLLNTPLVVQDVIHITKDLIANLPVAAAYPGILIGAIAAVAVHGVIIFFLIKKERPCRVAVSIGHPWIVRAAVFCVSTAAVITSWVFLFGQLGYRPERITEYNAKARHLAAMRVHEVTGKDYAYFLNAFEESANRQTTTATANFLTSFWKLGIYNPNSPRGARAVAELVDSTPPAETADLRPDIFAVLQESHADLSPLGITPEDISGLPKEPEPFWDGQTRVHTFGGGTPLSEFGFLSGFAWGDFGLAGLYSNSALSDKMNLSLPRRLGMLGYRTVAVYPVDGRFFNARDSYMNYGFEEFYSVDDLKIPSDWTSQKVSDAVLYEAAHELVDKSPKPGDTRPVFIFVLTIANHGPHNAPSRKPQAYMPENIPPKARPGMSSYLDGYEKTERELNQFASKWLDSKRPRLLAIFGDHWPSLEGGTLAVAENCKLTNDDIYTTISRIWINYASDATFPKKMDLAFLSTAIMETAKLPLDKFDAANRAVRIKTQGRYANYPDQQLIEGYLTYCRDIAHAWEP